MLERIVNNLVTNALNYTKCGRILVGCRRRGAALRILVADTGIGIHADDLGSIFEEFFQVANSERDRSKGLGLGLSIVKRSANLLGHTLVVRSVPGKGSQFGIEIPFVRWSQPEATRANVEVVQLDDLRDAFVAVIDDDADSRFATEARCLQWGSHVVSAGSSSELIEKLAEHLRVPDLILSDFRLRNGETGVAAVKRVRAEFDAEIAAIIISGDVAALGAQSPELAKSAFLSKPAGAESIRKAAAMLWSITHNDPPADG